MRLSAGAAVALLTGVLGLAGSARAAGCALGHGMRPVVSSFDLLAQAGAREDGERPASGLPESPCAGLRCSAGEPIPAPPTAPLSTLRSERGDALMISDAGANGDAFRLILAEATVHAIHFGPSLFRPPRGQ